jgi:glucans biosynthesis protein
VASFSGIGGRPGQPRPKGVRKFAIDFVGDAFAGLGRNDGVEIVVTASRGILSNEYSHPVVGQDRRWRAFFDIKAEGPEPIDIRLYLRHKGRALTETWIGQYFPEHP